MSNINSKNRNPFRPANEQLPQTPKTVGSTWEERQKYMKTQQISPAPQRAVKKSNIDQFKRKKVANTEQFNSNAIYKAGRRLFAGNAHKPAVLDGLENGNKRTVKPSDPSLINFLDRVIKHAKTSSRV